MRALIVGLVIILAGCGLWQNVDPGYQTATLTRDSGDSYSLGYNQGAATVTANQTNRSGNDRGIFWPAHATSSLNGETCARWAGENGGTAPTTNIQEGAALRIRQNRDGSTDTLTVTKNVWYDAIYIFNVHSWHAPSSGQNTSYTLLASKNLANVVAPGGQYAPLPWHLCAETVGNQLSYEVWTDPDPRPAYGDTTHGDTVTLDPNNVYPGYYGWYAGHLAAGQTVTFDQLTTQNLPG